MSLSLPTHLSFPRTFSSSNSPFLSKLCHLSVHSTPPALQPQPRKTTIIRMGGGPRTYPGGVSKWQWKRMQAKKAKQLLKARLCRERQIYEMRKRAELKAAVSQLERPWEVVEKAPNLFSVGADEQVKVLADRFQKPGGFDMWTDRDGPQLFRSPDGLPSARFFPKGVVHSVKPYGKVGDDGDAYGGMGSGSGIQSDEDVERNGYGDDSSVGLLGTGKGSDSEGQSRMDGGGVEKNGGKFWNKRNRGRFGSGVDGPDSGKVGFDRKQRGDGAFMRSNDSRSRMRRIEGSRSRMRRIEGSRSRVDGSKDGGVYDMSLQQDGTYGFSERNGQFGSNSRAHGAF